ncbi:hypothetical protein KZ779_05945 [Escherichia coli]|nr:hypothetical protein [Escherichia coli]
MKQCYPNTALVGVQVDSEQFGSQQVSRNYHLRGRILQVPSNYNPQTRQYSGIWDGTFKPAYSNNMAWCLWDMLTHPRYGMGETSWCGGCGQMGAVCHRPVLRPVSAGRLWRHGAAHHL